MAIELLMGMNVAQGVLQGILNRGAAKAESAIAEMRQQNANFQGQMEADRQNRNILRQFEDALVYNMRLEEAALKERARAELQLEDIFTNQKSEFSRNIQDVNAAMLSTFAGKGVDPTTGSARSILRSNMQNAMQNMTTLKKGYKRQLEDIELGYQNRLNQRIETSGVDLVNFIPNTSPIPDSSSSALMSGVLGGIIQAGSSYAEAQI